MGEGELAASNLMHSDRAQISSTSSQVALICDKSVQRSSPCDLHPSTSTRSPNPHKKSHLEDGEVVHNSFKRTYQWQPHQTGASHCMFNSYSANQLPNSNYKLKRKNSLGYLHKQVIAHLELRHLQRSLEEAVKEIEQLSSELQQAQDIISKLKKEFHSLDGSDFFGKINI